MEQVRLDDLRVFLAVHELGSLSATGRQLQLPKSSVSRKLARLEDALGARMLERSSRGLRLTDAGRVALDPARALVEGAVALSELVRERHETPRGRLRVSAPADLAGMEWWTDFAADHPLVGLEVEFSNRYVDLVREGFDVALRGGLGEDETLVARRVGAYRVRAVAAPEWVDQHGTFAAGDPLFSRGAVVLSSPRGPAPSDTRVLVANDNATALAGAIKGLGVSVLADHVCRPEMDRGRLLAVHPDFDPLEVPLYAVYPDKRHMRAALAAFVDAASQVLA